MKRMLRRLVRESALIAPIDISAVEITEYLRDSGAALPATGCHEANLVHCVENPSLVTALQLLPPDEQQLLDLAYCEEYSDAEIAKRLDISEAAATKRRQRIIRRLRLLVLHRENF